MRIGVLLIFSTLKRTPGNVDRASNSMKRWFVFICRVPRSLAGWLTRWSCRLVILP